MRICAHKFKFVWNKLDDIHSNALAKKKTAILLLVKSQESE